MEQAITGYKSGSQLFFKREGKDIVFDLKDLNFYKPLKSGKLKELKAGQGFFRNLTITQVANGFDNQVYKDLIRKISNKEYRLTNFGSIFAKLSKYVHIESYLLLGIESSISAFRNPASQFPKQVLEFMKESRIEFTSTSWESSYQKYPEMVTKLCTYVRDKYFMDLEVYRMVYQMICTTSSYYTHNGSIDTFILLSKPQVTVPEFTNGYRERVIKETAYGCEYKTLLDYLVRIDRTEALSFGEAMRLYRDYLKMMRDVERRKAILRLRETNPALDSTTVGFVGFNRVEKYPKYLRTRHDIVSKNYQVWSDEVDEVDFKARVEKGYAYKSGDYMMIVPTKADDVKNEGTDLHHCVASYVSRILDGTTQILFMREKADESFVTVEVRANGIVQARGYNNRSITSDEEKWLKGFAKAKNLNYLEVKRNEKMPTPPIYALQKYDRDAAFLRELSMLVNGASE